MVIGHLRDDPSSRKWIYSFVKDQGKEKKKHLEGEVTKLLNYAYVKQQDF